MFIISIFFLITTIYYSKKKYGSYFNHISVFVGVNIISLILMLGCPLIYNNISFKNWAHIYTMLISFLVGSYLGKYKFLVGNKGRIARIRKTTNFKRLKTIIIFYSVIYDIFAIYYILLLNSYYGLDHMFLNMTGLNIAVQNGDFQTGICSYFTPIGIPLSLMLLYYRKYKGGGVLLYIQYALCYLHCISPRRDSLFYMIVMSLMFLLVQSNIKVSFKENTKKKIKRGILIIAIIMVAVWIMSYTQNLMNKSSTLEYTVFGFKVPEVLKDVFLYIAGNFSYLEKAMSIGILRFEFPFISSLRLLYRYFGELVGVNIDTTTPFALSFLNIGVNCNQTFNTAPMLYYAILEAGVLFFFIFIFAGFLSRRAYAAVNEKNNVGKIMLGLFQFDIIIFSFRSYNLIYLTYILSLLYILIAHAYVDVDYEEDFS